MLRIILTFLFFTTWLPSLRAAGPTGGIRFVANQGQWPADVRFRADLPGGFLYVKQQSLHYVFYDTKAVAERHAGRSGHAPANDLIRAHGVTIEFAGSRPDAVLEGRHRSATQFSYLTATTFGQPGGPGGSDARPATTQQSLLATAPALRETPAFSEVVCHGLYPGVALRLYAFYETLKYEFTVQPGADPDRIRLHYVGADALRLTDGRLEVQTSVTTFRENRPYCYTGPDEATPGVATPGAARTAVVDAAWAVSGTTATFSLPGGYDRSQPLTIDPELVFSTYSGAYADNWGFTATYDAEGNLYSGGIAFGTGFPTTTGAFQVRFSGEVDVAIMKFNPDGTKLLYATYLGGEWADVPHSLIVNSQGELVILGTTGSARFPTTAGAFQRQFRGNGGAGQRIVSDLAFPNGSDLFVAKLSANGQQLTASTLLGGSNDDGLNLPPLLNGLPALTLRNYGDEFRGEVIVGPDNDVYVASETVSADFPGAPAAGATTLPPTGYDAVALRLSADLRQLRWATRIGGSGYDVASGLRLGATGNLFVCGTTTSPNLPAATDAYQTRLRGTEDGFVARIDNAGRLGRLTYLGTDATDAALLLDLGPDGTPYVFGLTRGRYPITAGTYQNAGSGQYVHALDTDLRQTVFSTVIGSGRSDPDISPTAFLVNDCGNIYVAGWGGAVNLRTGYNPRSSTSGMPVTANAYRRTTTGSNFWIAILERGARSLLYATYIGSESSANPEQDRGDHVDGGTCRFDKNGIIYHAACACGGSRFPATAQAWSKTNNSTNCNNVAFKFNVDQLKAQFDTYEGNRKDVVEGCAPLALSFVNTSLGGVRYEWAVRSSTGAEVARSTDARQTGYRFDKPGDYVVVLRAYNPLTCTLVDSTKKVITIRPAAFRVSPDTTICADRPVTLTASGATKYVWSPADGSLSNPSVPSPVARPKKTTTYTVEMTNEFGCVARRTVTVSLDDSFRPQVDLRLGTGCGQPAQLVVNNRTQNAERLVWSMGNGDTLRADPTTYRYPQSGQYAVVVTAYRKGCALSATLPVLVENLNAIPNVITPNGDGKNDVFSLGFDGAQLEVWNRWGRLTYRSASYANDWGRNVAHGTYYYLMTTPGGQQCKGWLEVLR